MAYGTHNLERGTVKQMNSHKAGTVIIGSEGQR